MGNYSSLENGMAKFNGHTDVPKRMHRKVDYLFLRAHPLR